MQDSKLAIVAALIGYGEASQILGVKRGTLYCWVSRRSIPFIRLGRRVVRFDPLALQEWVDQRTVLPDAELMPRVPVERSEQ